jgi:hypothetical protein
MILITLWHTPERLLPSKYVKNQRSASAVMLEATGLSTNGVNTRLSFLAAPSFSASAVPPSYPVAVAVIPSSTIVSSACETSTGCPSGSPGICEPEKCSLALSSCNWSALSSEQKTLPLLT